MFVQILVIVVNFGVLWSVSVARHGLSDVLNQTQSTSRSNSNFQDSNQTKDQYGAIKWASPSG